MHEMGEWGAETRPLALARVAHMLPPAGVLGVGAAQTGVAEVAESKGTMGAARPRLRPVPPASCVTSRKLPNLSVPGVFITGKGEAIALPEAPT